MEMSNCKCPHDSSIDELFFQYDKCRNEKDKIVSFFLASLSTHNLLWRSFLPAFAITRTYPRHHFEPKNGESDPYKEQCAICGSRSYIGLDNERYNILLNLSVKFGGLGVFIGIEECIVLLTEFNKLSNEEVRPVDEDFRIFSDIMTILTTSPTSDNIKKEIIQKIKRIKNFKTNKYLTKTILETLGFCGILETEEYKSPFHQYVNLGLAPKKSYNSEWEYPVDFWTPADGMNREAFRFWFGSYPQLKQFF